MLNIFNRNIFCDGSFHYLYTGNIIEGISFDIEFPDPRGTHLSCFENFEVILDGMAVNEVRFCLNDKKFLLWNLKDLSEEYWSINVCATIEILQCIEKGEHEVLVQMDYRIPFTGGFDECDVEHVEQKKEFYLQ